MLQVLQSLKDGKTEIADVPCPSVRTGTLLIRSRRTLVSAGTERMLVEFGRAGWIAKARSQPDKVRQVIQKIRTDGLAPTLQAVMSKLGQPMPLGYCNVGTVLAVGAGVEGFAPGDRVVSNGRHAEVVSVPANLCAHVPDGVSDDDAVFTVISAIGLQGIRLVQPTLGETVAVSGLGLIGLIVVQMLRSSGCRVIGFDFDQRRLELARAFGAETVNLGAGADPVSAAVRFSHGRGVDAVIVTAATQSNEPMHQAALMSRKRGRIVLVGVAGLALSRADFYEKELTFQVSCSYGPGRYDPRYEEGGQDYPLPYVRWTEQRNFEAVLDMMASGGIDPKHLVTHRFPIDDAPRAYHVVTSGEPSLGILLNYRDGTDRPDQELTRATIEFGDRVAGTSGGLSLIGSGNYAIAQLIPAFRAAGCRLRTVSSGAGVSGLHAARKFGFESTTTDSESVLRDPETAAVAVSTRHDSHASFVLRALRAGKHVFVEKPLCLEPRQVDEIEEIASAPNAPVLMVGFNRRFSPLVERMQLLLASVTGPRHMVFTANAGAIPSEHWTQDRAIGGGRIVGEGCHFMDLLRFVAGSPITSVAAMSMQSPAKDTATIQLGFANGSTGTVHYFANGSKDFPKERLEVHASAGTLRLDNFRSLHGEGWPGFRTMKLWRQDKGRDGCVRAFLAAMRGEAPPPIPLAEILEVARVSIEAQRCVDQGG
jgi:predicted dehydrogenase/threonine dehydrogenase-like Zn-dependent dehydrogenase